MVFNQNVMREYLTKEAFKSVEMAIEKGTKIERKVADQVASAMKSWAMNKGATHYTHWFHPLTGSTAENTTHLSILLKEESLEEFRAMN